MQPSAPIILALLYVVPIDIHAPTIHTPPGTVLPLSCDLAGVHLPSHQTPLLKV